MNIIKNILSITLLSLVCFGIIIFIKLNETSVTVKESREYITVKTNRVSFEYGQSVKINVKRETKPYLDFGN